MVDKHGWGLRYDIIIIIIIIIITYSLVITSVLPPQAVTTGKLVISRSLHLSVHYYYDYYY